MGMLAAYYYFFEPYYPEAFESHVINSIFSMFPLTNTMPTGWISKSRTSFVDSYQAARRV